MLAHSKVCYKNPALLLKDPNQTNLVSGEGGFLVPTSQRFNAAACRKAINTFVILDEHSFRVVEGVGFKQMCKQLQPQMAIPTRRTVARDCFQLYLAEKSRLKAFFKSDCTRVALTTDCWTSIQNLSYMATTAHFIDTAWKYQKKIISFSLVPNHKGDTIGMKVEDVLREWGLRKVSTITLDNATANDVAVSYLDRRLKSKNALLGVGDYLHMRCAAHVLNLVVRDGEKEHEGSIESVRTAVRFVRSSPQRAMKFKECVELAGITCKKKLCLDVSTRWNSTYLMLDAAEKFEAAFDNMIDEDPGYIEYFDLLTGPPGSQDWKKVRAFVVFLQTFYEATKVFSTSQEVSLHLAFHNLSSILCELQEASFNLNSYVAPMISHMKVKYDKYWGDVGKVNHFLYYGVIFDPRFKFNYIEWSFNDMYGHSSDLAKKNIECVKTSLFKLYNWHKSDHDENVGASPLSAPGSTSLGEASSQPKEPSPFTRANAFKKHLKEKDTIENENELEKYLGDPCCGEGENFSILNWWKENCTRYPILATLVRDVLATPVSSVASESAFSTGGRILDIYRSSLSPDMVEALICTQNWLKPSDNDLNVLNMTEEYEISESIVSGTLLMKTLSLLTLF